jgi:filamentous hemagglutinin
VYKRLFHFLTLLIFLLSGIFPAAGNNLTVGSGGNIETLAQQADRSAVAAQASAVVAQTVGDVSDAMSNGSLVENGFEEGGIYRAGLHGLSQGLVAGLGGGNAAAAGAGAAASSYFAPTFHTGNEETDKLLGNLVSGGLGFAIGGVGLPEAEKS